MSAKESIMPNLTVVLDHVAVLRQSMQSAEPDPVTVAVLSELAGADGIAVHLHHDRRHIQDRDLRLLRQVVQGRLILHIAPTSEMMGVALDVKPERVVLMPEVQEALSTIDGMDLIVHGKDMFETIDTLQSNGISVGLCISPEPKQAQLAHQLRVDWVQLHAGRLRESTSPAAQKRALDHLVDTVKMAHKLRTRIAIGHGLNHRLIKLFAGISEIDEFSLGQSLIARALLIGVDRAVGESAAIIQQLGKGNWS
jgi:pyridoxine 5-phosphate synthase